MRFWDSSAIVPLLVLERETEQCIRALESDKEVMVWTLRLLQVHPLRATDAMQLASVLVATQEDTSRVPIMSFDNRLTVAARLEGFTVNLD